MSTILSTHGLVKRFGGLTATDRLDLDIRAGELHALIGPNGAGKSTLLAQLAGELAPTTGRIEFDGQDITALPVHRRARIGIARSYQTSSVFPEFTALQNVMFAVQARSGHSFGFWRRTLDDARLVAPAQAALADAGLAAQAQVPVSQLAHGMRRQLEIAMALAMQPRVLLLDEPMAGMSPAESQAVVALLQGLKGRCAIALVEHDMDAVFALADRITVLVYGQRIACGTPAAIRADTAVRAAYLGEEGALL